MCIRDRIVNGRVISKRTQRVNKLFSRGRGVGAPLAWQVWGGSFHMDRWSENGKKTRPAKESWLAGASTSGSLSTLSWAATGYGYDNQAVGETRLTLPLGGAINVNLQNMLASDSSWSSIGSISATLPGGFSSLWVNQEKTRIGNQLRRSDADNRAIGGTLNLNSLWSKLGTFSISCLLYTSLTSLQRQLAGGEKQFTIHRSGAQFTAARAINSTDGNTVYPCAFVVIHYTFADKVSLGRQRKCQIADRNRCLLYTSRCV